VVSELVAQLRVLAPECGDCVPQAVAFVTDRRGVAELAGERAASGERALELVLGAGKRRGQAVAVNDVRVLCLAEASLDRRW
jgi:hypothetical protein